MVNHKYGKFSDMQVSEIKEILRKRIFFLLVVAEDNSKFPKVNLPLAHTTLMWKISGLNELLGEPTELVTVLSLLEEALNNLKTDFDFAKYRKLILDAGAEVLKIASSDEPEITAID